MEMFAFAFAGLLAYGIFGIVATIIIYFLPCIIAMARGASSGWLFFVNLVLGWTFFFWVVCLIWGFFTEKRQIVQQVIITHIDGTK